MNGADSRPNGSPFRPRPAPNTDANEKRGTREKAVARAHLVHLSPAAVLFGALLLYSDRATKFPGRREGRPVSGSCTGVAHL